MQALMHMLFCLVVDTQGKGCARAYRLQLLSGMITIVFTVFATKRSKTTMTLGGVILKLAQVARP